MKSLFLLLLCGCIWCSENAYINAIPLIGEDMLIITIHCGENCISFSNSRSFKSWFETSRKSPSEFPDDVKFIYKKNGTKGNQSIDINLERVIGELNIKGKSIEIISKE